MKEYLENRIKHLKKVEIEYWNKTYDMTLPKHERDCYRVFFKDFESRRMECEITLKFYNEGICSGTQ